MGQPSGKFDDKVFYSKLPSHDIPIESIMSGGWGYEFDDDEPVNEEEKKAENIEQFEKEIEDIMPPNGVELLNRKETCGPHNWSYRHLV